MKWTEAGDYVCWYGKQDLTEQSTDLGQAEIKNLEDRSIVKQTLKISGSDIFEGFEGSEFELRSSREESDQHALYQEVIYEHICRYEVFEENFKKKFKTRLSREGVTLFYPQILRGVLYRIDQEYEGLTLSSVVLILIPEFKVKSGGVIVRDDGYVLYEILPRAKRRCLFDLMGQDLNLYCTVRNLVLQEVDLPITRLNRCTDSKEYLRCIIDELNSTYFSDFIYSSIEPKLDDTGSAIDKYLCKGEATRAFTRKLNRVSAQLGREFPQLYEEIATVIENLPSSIECF